MENFSILEFIKEKFIGKTIKHCIKREQIIQPYNVWVRKSGSVTDKQWKDGNPRFRKEITRFKSLGWNSVYANSKIVEIRVSYSNGYEGYDGLRLILDNGSELDLEVETEVIKIDNETYMLK